jgi:hypothetical protein
MNAPFRTGPRLLGGLLAALLLLATAAAPAPARAAAPAGRVAVPLAAGDGFSISSFLSGLSRRERVVQFCFGVMCLALFILCKKFDEHPR